MRFAPEQQTDRTDALDDDQQANVQCQLVQIGLQELVGFDPRQRGQGALQFFSKGLAQGVYSSRYISNLQSDDEWVRSQSVVPLAAA